MKKIVLSIMLLFALTMSGQISPTPISSPTPIDWTKMGDNEGASFYEIQNTFNAHWEGKTITKGCGYKPFRRWEAFMIPRVYPTGNVILPYTNYENFKTWAKQNNVNSRSATAVGNWSPLGPVGKPLTSPANALRTGTGRLNFIRVDPTDSMIIFVGAPDGGVWRSTNGGASWSTNTDFLGVIGCNDLVFDPNNTQTIYLATGDLEGDRRSIGILKSTNGGNTWNTTGLSWTVQQGYKTSRLLMDTANPLKMLVTTNRGVFMTTDGWVTSTTGTFPGGALPNLKDAELKPNTPNTVYASGTELYKSTNFGASWTQVTSGLPTSNVSRIALAVTPGNANYVYAVIGKASNESFLGFYKSSNSASSFTTQYDDTDSINILGYDLDGQDKTAGQAFYDLVIAANPTNPDNVTVSSINQWQTNDGGYTWDIISHWTGDGGKPTVHSDFHEITYQPGSSTTLYAGSDGGIWRSRDNGVNWTDISNNLNISQINKFGISQSDSTLINAGMQDNGTNFKTGTDWHNIFGGDGGESFIDHSDNNTLYFCYTNSQIHRSDDGGLTENQVTNGLPNGGASGADFYSSFHQDPVVASRIYAGGHPALYISNNKADNWSVLGTPQGSGNITEFAIAPSDNQVIYALKNDAVSKSINGGTTWTDITGTLPVSWASPVMVAVSKHNKNKVWVVFSGYSSGDKVHYSKDGGATWTDISAGLPNLPINTVVSVDNSIGDAIYVGADIGVYYYDTTMTAFTPFFTNLARASVRDLEIHYATGKIRAATYGRGVWQSDLNSATKYNLKIAVTGTNNKCNGDALAMATVKISSGNAPYTYSWSNGGTTDTIKNITAGTYTVTVTDAEGKIETASYTVTEPTAITVNCTGTATSSIGGTDGTASVAAATGGTNTSTLNTPYSFPGAPFSVDATSGNAIATSTMTIPALPAGAVLNSASLDIDTYTALGNSWQSDPYIKLSGLYTLAFTQLSTVNTPGTITPNVSINLPSFPTTGGVISFEIDEATNDIGVDATVAGVTITLNYTLNGYTYSWSNGSTATSLTGLSAGAYTITVTDAIGCSNTCTYNVNDPGANHNITASAGTNGTISPSGITSLANHGNQTYTFTPASCYEVDTVLIDGVYNSAASSASSYTFSNVTDDHTIDVTYKMTTSTITPYLGSNGTISPSAPTTVNCGGGQVYTFTANTCYEIDSVWIDGVNNNAAATAGSYSFTNVTTDQSIEVTFKLKAASTITATSGANGTISSAGASSVNCGASKVYTFTANTCYEIDSVWIDGVNNNAAATAGTYTFTNVSAAHNIDVTFKSKTPSTITATSDANGAISSAGASSVNCGASKTYTFTANSCYEIDSVWVDGINNNTAATAGSYTFTNVTTAHNIDVTFKLLPASTITAFSGANGTISSLGASSVNCGASKTYTFTANTCYEIDSVWVDGVYNNTAVTAGSYTFSNVTAAHDIEVTFISITPARPTITLAGLVLTSDATTGNQWYNLSGVITGETNQTYTATATDTYYTVVSNAGCISDSSNNMYVIVAHTGITTIDGKEINIYPNPVFNELTIEIADNESPITYEIINAEGKTVLKGDLINKTVVNTSVLAKGTYIVKLQNEKIIKFKKLIKN